MKTGFINKCFFNKWRFLWFALFFAFSVFIMVTIFNFSSQNAQISSNESGRLLKSIIGFFYQDFNSFTSEVQAQVIEQYQNLIRKTAHFSIYGALGFCVLGTVKNIRLNSKVRNAFSVVFCLLYAITDEVHQVFVPGRAGRWYDVLIDLLGSVCGIILMNLICFLYKKLKCCKIRLKKQ